MVTNFKMLCLRYDNLLKAIETIQDKLKEVNDTQLTKSLLLLKLQKGILIKQLDKLKND